MAPVTLDRPAVAGLTRAQADPAGFLTSFLAADLWDKQVEIAESVRDHRRTAVKSCHASGKSFLAARLVIWFLHAFPRSVVLTTAPTQNQVRNILWRELNTAHASNKQRLLGTPLTQEWTIAPDWYAIGFKAADTQPDRFQGFHAEYALVIVDEAAGVVPLVFEALNAVMTSETARMLLIGNPTTGGGVFYDAFHGARELFHTITIAAEDTPNIQAGHTVRPYLITQQWIDDAVAEHGLESPYVQSRVFARFPSQGEDTLIDLGWIEAAKARADEVPVDPTGPIVAGLDVARMGGDENALCIRQGPHVLALHTWTGLDTMETVGKVRHILATYPALEKLNVDVIGVGAGVADRLREQNYPVIDVNVASASRDAEKWANLRDELWWNLRSRFRDGDISGDFDERTIGQLAGIKYRYDSRHTHPRIESKDDARKRGVRSPDRGDAVMLAFAQVGLEGDVFSWVGG